MPYEFLAFLAVLVAAQRMLWYTPFGRNLYMVGSSPRAADAAGVRNWRTLTGVYLWASLFSAVSGVMLAMRYNSASMEYGINYDYDAIAAVLVGGTAMSGGRGSALRTLAGVMVIGLVQMLLLHGLRQEWQLLITGLIVLAINVAPGPVLGVRSAERSQRNRTRTTGCGTILPWYWIWGGVPM